MEIKVMTMLAAGLLGSSLLGSPVAAQEKELVIGVHASLSGAGAALGEAMVRGAEIAADDVNDGGGLEVAGERYKIRLVTYDDHSNVQNAVTLIDRMIYQDELRFIVGPMSSAAVAATVGVTNDNEVINIPMGFTPKALSPSTTFTFRPVVTTTEFSDMQVKWTVEKLGFKRIGALLPNDETGQQVGAANMKAYEAAGAEYVLEVFDRDRIDFVPLLTQLLPSIDALDLGGNTPATAGNILKAARDLGYTGPVTVTGGDVVAALISSAGVAGAEGVYVHMPTDLTLPDTAVFVDNYRAKYGDTAALNGFSPNFYAALQMLFASIQKTGNIEDTTAIAQAMGSLADFPTVLGPVNWTGQETYGINHQLAPPVYIGQVKDGQVVRVATCIVDSGCN